LGSYERRRILIHLPAYFQHCMRVQFFWSFCIVEERTLVATTHCIYYCVTLSRCSGHESPSMSTSVSPCSSACSTLMWPAARQTLPIVAFHNLTRPSFPEEHNTVLRSWLNSRSEKRRWRTYPVTFHSTLPTDDLERCKIEFTSLLQYFAHLWSSKSAATRPDHFPSLDSSPVPSGRFTLHILT
jgi:hypothetical protein